MDKSDIRSEVNAAVEAFLSKGGKISVYQSKPVKVSRRVKVKPHLFIKPSEPREVVSMFYRLDERRYVGAWNNW